MTRTSKGPRRRFQATCGGFPQIAVAHPAEAMLSSDVQCLVGADAMDDRKIAQLFGLTLGGLLTVALILRAFAF
jgi:hypothetical protein